MSAWARVLLAAALLVLGGCGGAAPASPSERSAPLAHPAGASSPMAACPGSATAALRGPAYPDGPVPGVPTGALVCSVNVASKRTPTVTMTAAQAAALARLLDAGAPTDAARRCRHPLAVTLVRFTGTGGDTDVTGSSRCRSVVYAGGGAYTLSAVARDYLTSLIAGGSLEPDLTGLALPDAIAAADRAHRRLMLLGALPGSTGRVMLQAAAVGREIDVLVGMGPEPACRPAQLRLAFEPGEPSAGSDGGTLTLRNVGASWCRLTGPVAVTGLTEGRAVTSAVALRLRGVLDLSPHGAPMPRGFGLRRGVLEAEVVLSAEYRDDARAADGSCSPHWVVPATWRVVIDGRPFTLPNGEGRVAQPIGSGGLVTCRGGFGALPVRPGAF